MNHNWSNGKEGQELDLHMLLPERNQDMLLQERNLLRSAILRLKTRKISRADLD